jgi:peptide/nickel transport system permease protein
MSTGSIIPRSGVQFLGRHQKWLETIRPRSAIELYGALVLAIMLVAIVAAPLVARYDPYAQDLHSALRPPDGQHWLGTDTLGRDYFARVVYGGRTSLLLGALVVAIAAVIGVALGAISGFLGGFVDEVLMRIVDIFLAFPPILLALVISAALGPNLLNAAIAVAAAWWPTYARLVRAQVLVVKEREFVTASRSLGATSLHTLWRAVLPNSLGAMKTILLLDVGYAILAGSTLNFFGLGVSEPTPEWGLLIRDALSQPANWWLTLSPGLAIVAFVSALQFAGGVVTRSIYEQGGH